MHAISYLLNPLNFIRHWPIKFKFVAIAVLTIAPLVFLLSLNIQAALSNMNITKLEHDGIVYLNPIRHFIENLQAHRGMTNSYLSGDTSFAPKIDANEEKTDALIASIDVVEASLGARLHTTQNWDLIKQDWGSIKTQWQQIKQNSKYLSPEENFTNHTALVQRLLDFMLQVSDSSTLTLDPQIDTYYLIDIAYLKTPSIIENLAKMRGLGAGIAARKTITGEERMKLMKIHLTNENAINAFMHSISVLSGVDSVKSEVKAELDHLKKDITDMNNLVKTELVDAKVLTISASSYYEVASQNINRTYAAFDNVSKLLDTLLMERLHKQQVALYQTITLVALMVLVIGFVLLSIARNITQSTQSTKQLMLNLADGKLGESQEVKNINRDEMGDMARAAASLDITLSKLIQSMNHMSKEHDAGDIDVVIDEAKFKGAYKDMAAGVNNMVNGHIAVKKKAIAVVTAFGEGNFDMPLEQLPGKKAFINKAIEEVRGHLKEVIVDMNHMSKEHDAGDIDVVMDEAKFKGAYKDMAAGVNKMVNGHIAVKKKAIAVVTAFGEGNFDMPLEQLPGKKAFINKAIEEVRGHLKEVIVDMNHMSKEHDAGDIDVVMDEAKFKGAYKDMAAGVNKMVNGHIAVNKQAMACIKGFGEGDFDAPMAKLPGKKAFINETIEQVRRNLKALSDDASMLSEAAADGRVTVRADTAKHHGDFRKVIEGVNATLETIVKPIVAVKEAAETINTAANEISSGNNDLSQRTEEQASSLEETASSMEELASTVKQNAENAKQANQLAITASDVAIKGGAAVDQVVNTMSAINDSARKIEDIISVIDGIAFQTNILALNAAVEAARAGEQGRGFAVVAGEVRNLAQRSASAAKEIKDLITDSVTKTTEGTQQVENAGRTMEEIVTSVKRVSDIIGEITAASIEQSAGIDQVNQAITSMDETTQQNAALVEQAAAAAESLLDQANALSESVSVFKLDNLSVSNHERASASYSPLLAVKKGKTGSKGVRLENIVAIAKTGTDATSEWEAF